MMHLPYAKSSRTAVLLLIGLAAGSAWAAGEYRPSPPLRTTVQITDNAKSDQSPQINEKGNIVWQGEDEEGKDWEIFFYDSADRKITQVTHNDEGDSSPQINGLDWIVWQGDGTSKSEIFLYDGSGIRQLTENFFTDRSPHLNDAGQVVWEQNQRPDWEILFYDGAEVRNVSDNLTDDRNPRINGNGRIVWQTTRLGKDDKIRLYDPDTKSASDLGDPFSHNRNPDINDNNEVVWESQRSGDEDPYAYEEITLPADVEVFTNAVQAPGDRPQGPRRVLIKLNIYKRWEIYFYDGLQALPLTYNRFIDRRPRLNARGDLVWEQLQKDGWDVFLRPYEPAAPQGRDDRLYEDDEPGMVNISGRMFDDINPCVNARGHVVWQGFDGHDWEIFLFDGRTRQLTDNMFDDTDSRINDNGEIVWQGFDGRDWEIFLSRPAVELRH